MVDEVFVDWLGQTFSFWLGNLTSFFEFPGETARRLIDEVPNNGLSTDLTTLRSQASFEKHCPSLPEQVFLQQRATPTREELFRPIHGADDDIFLHRCNART